jgi:hypothetical protein
MKIFTSLALIGLLSTCAPSRPPTVEPGRDTLEFGTACLPFEAEKGVIFHYYRPHGKSKWRENWTKALDLTGVSWTDECTATLISPSHVVMAAHFKHPLNEPLTFHDKEGNPHERHIVAFRDLRSVGDVSVGKVNQALPKKIKFYQLADRRKAWVGKAVLVSDQTRTLNVHRIAAISNNSVHFKFLAGMHPVYRRNLVRGDSGHPSFICENGQLTLLETHTTGGPGAGPFYGSPRVQAAVRAAMAELGD